MNFPKIPNMPKPQAISPADAAYKPVISQNVSAGTEEARSQGVPLPAAVRLHYFSPLRFLRSLPIISDSLHWINENALIKEEKDHSGKIGHAKDAAGSQHTINNITGLSSLPREEEWR